MQTQVETAKLNNYRLLIGFIISPLVTPYILIFHVEQPLLLTTLFIPYLVTVLIAVPYFLMLYKFNKINLLLVILGGIITGLELPSYVLAREVLSITNSSPTHLLLTLFFFCSIMGLISSVLFWLISINKKWPVIDMKGVIISFILLIVLVTLFSLIMSVNTKYLYVLTWGLISILSYSLITRHKIYPSNNRLLIKINQAKYGLIVFTPLSILSILINIEDSAGVTFTIIAGILINDGYQIYKYN